jgi:EpsI family protein
MSTGTPLFQPGRRELLIGGAMLATASAATVLVPRSIVAPLQPGELERIIPRDFGGWRFVTSSGLVLPPQDETEARTYDQVLTRVYSDGQGPPVMLLIAYGGGQSGLFVIHRPEACYPAQGYRLRDKAEIQFPIGPASAVTGTFWSAVSDVRSEQLLYWTRIGDDFPQSWAAEQVTLVRNNLSLVLPDGVLVRMSMVTIDPAAAQKRLAIFARALVAGVRPLGRRVLLGDHP